MQTRTSFGLFLGRLGLRGAVFFGSLICGLTSANAYYNVTISTAATFHGSISGCVFTPTGNNAILNVTDLQTSGTSCDTTVNTAGTITGGPQPGNITVADTVQWYAHILTLNAHASIKINALLDVSVATSSLPVGIVLNDGGMVGQLSTGSGGRVMFGSKTLDSLTINGHSYTLENTIGDSSTAGSLAGDIYANSGTGYYAWMDNIDVSATSYTASPIATAFSGTFEGLGNAMSNLTINDPTTTMSATVLDGLFANLVVSGANAGTINDLGLNNVSVTVSGYDGQINVAGSLVALNNGGTSSNDSASGTILVNCPAGCSTSRFHDVNAGGLVGKNEGSIMNSSSSAAVTNNAWGAYVGGLVGRSIGTAAQPATISSSNASGVVTGSAGSDHDGGLVGNNEGGLITGSSAAGVVACQFNDIAGGLVGDNEPSVADFSVKGIILASHATGNVGSITGCKQAGGLVGQNGAGGEIGPSSGLVPIISFATGNVASSQSAGGFVESNFGFIKYAYAMGDVTADGVAGGLVATNGKYGNLGGTIATISQSYSKGMVTNPNADFCCFYGGLVGVNQGSANIDNSYSRSDIDTKSTATGGFVGANGLDGTPTVLNASYEIGTVTFSGTGSICIGGFVGSTKVTATGGSQTNAYWNTTTSGQASGWGTATGCSTGAGTVGTCSGAAPWDICGESTSALKAALPVGFSSSIWGLTGGINGGYPYLLNNH